MRTLTLPLSLAACVAGGAHAQEAPTPLGASADAPIAQVTVTAPPHDPMERTNRTLFGAHQQIDRNVLGPVARGYKAATPSPVRKGIRNVLNNLGEPVTFINDVLQGRPVKAGEAATRFVTNSTVGLLGVFDVATAAGVERHEEDFGQTLATYGVKPGPYIVVPVLGPTNARDLTGRVVDVLINPVNSIGFDGATAARSSAVVLNGVDARAEADEEITRLNTTATDPYATYRSLYSQNRRARVANGEGDMSELPDFEDYPAEPVKSATPPRRRR